MNSKDACGYEEEKKSEEIKAVDGVQNLPAEEQKERNGPPNRSNSMAKVTIYDGKDKI